MKKGDYIIWNSGNGYDVGYFSKEDGVTYYTHEVKLITGLCKRSVSFSKDQIHPFSSELVEALNNKYGYKRSPFWNYKELKELLEKNEKS